MMRPSTSKLVIGYPAVTTPLLLLDAFVGYLFTAKDGFGFPTLIALLVAGGLLKCSGEAASYRAWRRDWNALDPNYRPPRPIRATLRFLGQLIVAVPTILGFFWLLVNWNDPNSPARLIAILVPAGLFALWIAAWWVARRAKARRRGEWLVAQGVRRSLPAPAVPDAYAALPDYCQPLLSSTAP